MYIERVDKELFSKKKDKLTSIVFAYLAREILLRFTGSYTDIEVVVQYIYNVIT